MSCPINDSSGLITLMGGITTLQLNSITPHVNDHPVEVLTFPERRTPPTRRGTFVEEVNPEKNVCTVKGNKGELIGIQMCQKTHTGYQMPGNTRQPLAELILSFYVRTRAAGSAVYHGILLCLPIYEAIPSQQHHHEYLTAVMTGSMTADASTLPSLSSLFYSSERDTSQVSLSYKTCVEVKDGAQQFSTRSLAVFVFPHGIHIASNVLQPFLAQQTLHRFRLPSLIREGKATASNYRFNEGVKEITDTSSDGVLYTTSMNSCNDEFKSKMQYFVRPPPIPSVSPSSVTTKKTLTTSQYKCVPFDKLQHVSAGEIVDTGVPLKRVMDTQENFKKIQDTSRVTGFSSEQMEGMIAGTIISVGVIAGVIYAVHYRTST
jgi:hypothetical protein